MFKIKNYKSKNIKILFKKELIKVKFQVTSFCNHIFAIMRKLTTVVLILFQTLLSCQNNDVQIKTNKVEKSEKIVKSEEDWKKILSPEQYRILREKGTERPYTGEFNLHHEKGIYLCAACGNELFSSDMKFDSHCGWPSFDDEIGKGDRILKIQDLSHGMVRTEIICSRCESHLGHIFDDGPTNTGKRYCVNSVSMKFIKK